MGREEEEEEEEEEEGYLDPTQLLNLAETHLRLRNFTLSRQYSLEFLSSPSPRRSLRSSATLILTLSDILSDPDNHYSVLQLDSFSSNFNLIRSHFKNLIYILDPIKHSSPLAHEAIDYLNRAHSCLSDPLKKAEFDTHLRNSVAVNDGRFWTFCPYCFYVYEYDMVYEGCCLRCQNSGCRRVFQGVGLTSLPKMELDKGLYFGCYGYFPMGFSPGGQEMSKCQSWSPVVGMFPANNPNVNATNFTEILDESDDSDTAGVQGRNVDTDRPRGMRRKSVARRKRRNTDSASNGSGDRFILGEDDDFPQDIGLHSKQGVGNRGGGEVGDLNEVDMAFFEGDGEVFVGLGSDDGL